MSSPLPICLSIITCILFIIASITAASTSEKLAVFFGVAASVFGIITTVQVCNPHAFPATYEWIVSKAKKLSETPEDDGTELRPISPGIPPDILSPHHTAGESKFEY